LHLLIGDVDTGETLYSGVKEMRSGQQIYEKKDERDIGHAIRSG
jgi:hypothetical protein